MTKTNNTTNPPVSFEVAQRFLADFHFCSDFWDEYGDDCMNGSNTPAHGKVLGQLMQSLLESSGVLLESLSDKNPAEFLGYCSSIGFTREMTDSEKKLANEYLTSG